MEGFRAINSSVRSDVQWILVPWNRSNHWALIAAHVWGHELIYLDPSEASRASDLPEFHQEEWEALGKVRSLLGWRNFSVTLNPERSTCTEEAGCGVWVCFYAKQLISGNSLEAEVNPTEMRQEIRETLKGNAER